MGMRRIIQQLMPPAIAWRLGRARREREELAKFQAFYRGFLQPGDLCFDIGANLGNRLRCFRSMGCRVVALEPQSWCFERLKRGFGEDPEVVLIQAAAGAAPGSAQLRISPDHVLSTLSSDFIEETRASGRFSAARWDRSEEVVMTSLDRLIDAHGMPAFVKIDVEGFESEVLAGLSRPVPALSIEWVPELAGNARRCLDRLEALGDYEYQISWGESMRFARSEWRSPASLRVVIDELEGESHLFGDIYARVRR